MRTSRKWWLISIIALVVISFILYVATLTPLMGFSGDDALYATLGKSIATGNGYRPINLPHNPIKINIPPFYPLVLSGVWKVFPIFPQNVLAMKFISIIFSLIFTILAIKFISNHTIQWIALSAGLLAAITPLRVSISTQIMTEMLYSVLSVSVLLFASKINSKTSPVYLILLSLGIIITFCTRAVGSILIFATGYFLAHRRYWKKFALFTTVSLVLSFICIFYIFKGKAPVTGFLRKSFEISIPGPLTVIDFGKRIFENSWTLISYGILGLFCPINKIMLFFTKFTGLSNPVIPRIIGLILNGLAIYGFISSIKKSIGVLEIYVIVYILGLCFYPWPSDRFLIPLGPFLFYYFLKGISLLCNKLHLKKSVVLSVLVVFITIGALKLDLYLAGRKERYKIRDSEFIHAWNWIKSNTPRNAILGCINPNQFYLYTDRHTIAWLKTLNLDKKINWVNENKIDYVIKAPFAGTTINEDLSNLFIQPVLDSFPNFFMKVYKSSLGYIYIYKVKSSELK
ncbi:glycosyltransferase family 39 protein [candidate division WOR-3 bacterium]|nr:glycosyltransferase family 39 protein [candidate division WOR-3 bacterium]